MGKEEAILLLIMSAGAFIIPLISKKLLLPSAVGEILFGMVLGIFFKGFIEEVHILKFLGEFGFIILMYLAGLEVDVENIKRTTKLHLTGYVLIYIIMAVTSSLIVYYFNLPLIYILVFITTAIGLLYPVLKDTGILHTNFGQRLLIIGSVGEVISLIAITIFAVYFQSGISLQSLSHLLGIYIFFAAAYVMLRLFQLYLWWYPEFSKLFVQIGDTAESGIRANFVNMFVFVSLASILGLEAIIGAFFGGLLFALVFKEREQIKERIASFGYGFLIPIFFIEVGLRFNIKELLHIDVLIKAIVLTLSILLIKFLGSLVLIFLRTPLWQVILTPIALSMPLTLLVAVATIFMELKVLDNHQGAIIILAAIISAIIYPWIFKIMVKNVKLN
ncbi:MAG: cation:proton antiporter [Aquificae bacterium]|nr:cation:proton antiporter [Aquificota bacterium]